jgi:hypothetical protein
MERAFGPWFLFLLSWGFAPGWYKDALLALTMLI